RLIGTHDYAQLFLLIEQLGLGPDGRAEAFRRMVFNVAAANCDDHAKNVSFLLPEDGSWQLAPHTTSPTHKCRRARGPGNT
ncbi:MAG: HipA domain-containing protein, partial [Actinomycetota bacterium]